MRFLRRKCARLCVFFSLVVGCSDPSGAMFVTDAMTPADAVATPDGRSTCTTSAQCDDRIACTRDLCVVGGICEHIPDGPSCMTARRCMRTADCDDRIACTRDTCLVDGVCNNTPQNEMCPSGQMCVVGTGCSSGMPMPGMCRTNTDCDDRIDCTVDACGADGRCTNTPQNSRCTTMGQVCRAGMGCIAERACSRDADCDDRLRCNGSERCVEFGCVAGTPVACDDGDACTVDMCVETGTMMCTSMRNPTCMGGAAPRSGIYGLTPTVRYTCVTLFGMTALNINMQRIQVVVTPTGITVTGAPAAMLTGGPIVGGRFSATGSVAGDCVETYTLSGMFSSERMFSGTFEIRLAGIGCALTDCRDQTFMVTGTLAI